MNGKEYFDFLHKLENNPNFCYDYLSTIHKKHPTYEVCLNTISKNAFYSRKTAEEIMKGRFELGEPAISKVPNEALWYARDVVKGRWEMGEEAIATRADYSFMYAKEVLRGRFILGEPAIAQDDQYATKYAMEIIKGKLPEEMHNVMLARHIAA